MTAKTYADGKGTTYTYNADGQLATRVWDRGITTTYSYDNAGRQTGIDYSDTTPDITYTYDWMGNPATVTDAEGTRTFSYNYTTSGHPGLASVTVPGIVNHSINYTYDAYGRRTAMSLNNNSTPVFTNNYGYDTTSGKLATIGDGAYTAHYTYQDGTGLITKNEIKNTASTVVTTHNRTYDTRLNNYHLLNTSNTTGATTRTYSYVYNDKDQRTKLTLADGSYWEYAYDDKGQVTSGVKKDASGKLIAGQHFGYNYDGIGNRIDAETKLSALKLTYSTNNVNQYTQINTPGIIPVVGEANADTTVQAVRTDASNLTNGKQKILPTRSGKYFSGAFTDIDNSTAAKTITYDVYAIKDETTTQKIQKASSSYTVPKAVTALTYDTDGNMLTDGTGWNYTWNGENRKIAAEKSDMKLEFVYDYMGRRVSKKVYTGSTGNWTLSTHQKFVYNGYKQIAEYNAITGTDTLQKTYAWQPVGLDVPLWVNDSSTYYFYIVDGNKNVRAMVDASGTIVAEYDYNPFGKVVVSKESYAGINKYRFSSECHDDETGLVYYNYRYYDVDLGRWINRDPIEEAGGENLYGMVRNNPINDWDKLGNASAAMNSALGAGFGTLVPRLPGLNYQATAKQLRELSQWRDREIIRLAKKLQGTCPTKTIKKNVGKKCCTITPADCKKEAAQIARGIAGAVYFQRYRHMMRYGIDVPGGNWFTNRMSAFGGPGVECGDWQVAMIEAIQRRRKSECSSFNVNGVSVSDNVNHGNHNWVNINGIMIDPWGSGGSNTTPASNGFENKNQDIFEI